MVMYCRVICYIIHYVNFLMFIKYKQEWNYTHLGAGQNQV